MNYKLYLEEDGGCDYSIGCGRIIVDLKSTNMKEAELEAIRYIEDNTEFPNVHYYAEIYEVSSSEILDLASLKKQLLIRDYETEKNKIEFEAKNKLKLLNEKYNIK